MLPDGPNTSESQMSLPSRTLAQNNFSTSPPLSTRHANDSNQMLIEIIYPGIYFSNLSDYWTQEKLRSHGFTHIVHIDRHLHHRHQLAPSELSNTSPVNTIETSSATVTARLSISPMISMNNNDNNNKKLYLYGTQNENDGGGGAADRHCVGFKPKINTLDLNFGEESFLTTVLPNCYKAVKFIDKALQNGGAILVIDQFNDQKCLTIVIGYLMYKNNITFSDAYQRLKSIFKKAELEPFFISQLYEYEPILQVERAQSRGHSCSRELRSAQLKRKKIHDDNFHGQTDWNYNYPSFIVSTNNSHLINHQSYSDISSDVVME